jgi:putative acetyltransferase
VKNENTVRIRPAVPEDIPALKILCYDTITTVAVRDYDTEQVVAWASAAENTDSLARRITGPYFYVAEEEMPPGAAEVGGSDMRRFIAGFASLESKSGRKGYFDLLYVHKDYQRRGIATLLLKRILAKAREIGLSWVDVEASIPARPFFIKHNFKVSGEQTVFVKGIALRNYKMYLDLNQR